MKRKDMIPNFCCRCGNDLMTGRAILHLPFCKRYISLCVVCSKGLGWEGITQKVEPTQEQWNEFWEQEIKKEKKE